MLECRRVVLSCRRLSLTSGRAWAEITSPVCSRFQEFWKRADLYLQTMCSCEQLLSRGSVLVESNKVISDLEASVKCGS